MLLIFFVIPKGYDIIWTYFDIFWISDKNGYVDRINFSSKTHICFPKAKWKQI